MNPIGKTLFFLKKPWGKSSIPAEKAGPEPGEIAWADGLFFAHAPLEKWNPDALIWQRGYALYGKMLADDQIRALVSLKQSVVIARRWHFQVQDDSEAQNACRDYFQYLLKDHLEGTFSGVLRALLTSQTYGFSLLEKVYVPLIWRGATHWGLRALKSKPVETFSFETDAFGNRTGLLQDQGGKKKSLPPEKFVHHVNQPEIHPWYGESDLKACHRHWWSKENILKLWNIYLERMAAGFVHGRINGPLSNTERDELKKVMQNLNTRTSVITPGSVELKMISAPSTDAFERAVLARDRAMAKALLVPNLLGLSESGSTGSFAQSRTQLETFFFVLNSLAESLADTLNEQLFSELGWWNFGLKNPPRFVFDPLTQDQRRELAGAWQKAVSAGVVEQTPQDRKRTRELLDYPPEA